MPDLGLIKDVLTYSLGRQRTAQDYVCFFTFSLFDGDFIFLGAEASKGRMRLEQMKHARAFTVDLSVRTVRSTEYVRGT